MNYLLVAIGVMVLLVLVVGAIYHFSDKSVEDDIAPDSRVADDSPAPGTWGAQ